MKWWIIAAVSAPLFGCTTVEADRIRGANFAVADARFASLDPALDLGPSPLAGARRVFRLPELRRLAATHGITDVPSELCFERASQVLTAEKLRPLLEAALDGGPVEILGFSKYVVPQGTVEFARAGLATSGFWRGHVIYGDNRSAAVWAKVRTAGATSGSVGRGDTVRVEVRMGGVLLAFDAAAETSGRAGEAVLVKNPTNGRRFRALVEGNGKVSINK